MLLRALSPTLVSCLLTSAMLIRVPLVFATHMFRGRPPVETLLFAIALAVGLSPGLLPAILSVNLARGGGARRVRHTRERRPPARRATRGDAGRRVAIMMGSGRRVVFPAARELSDPTGASPRRDRRRSAGTIDAFRPPGKDCHVTHRPSPPDRASGNTLAVTFGELDLRVQPAGVNRSVDGPWRVT